MLKKAELIYFKCIHYVQQETSKPMKYVGDGVLSMIYLTQQAKLGHGSRASSTNNVTN